MLGLIISLSTIGGWTIPEQTQSPRQTVSVNAQTSPRVASLSYVCGGRDGSIGSFVFTSNTPLGGKNGHSAWREIELQIDKQRPVTTLWRYDGFQAIAAQRNNAGHMEKLLRAGQTLNLRAFDQNGRLVEASFDVAQAADQVSAAQRACDTQRSMLASAETK